MAKKQSGGGLVYSTDPDYKTEEEQENREYLPPKDQKIVVRLETKHRAGKAVTLVENFDGSMEQEEDLGKKLKAYCGTGGSVKNGEILVQGDHRDKVLQWLQKNGYLKARKQ